MHRFAAIAPCKIARSPPKSTLSGRGLLGFVSILCANKSSFAIDRKALPKNKMMQQAGQGIVFVSKPIVRRGHPPLVRGPPAMAKAVPFSRIALVRNGGNRK